jgi:GDP-mannose 6-dehydrogenase
MRISVFGLGYVGAISAACLARDGHEVIGVDVDENKLKLIERGQAPIIEQGVEELMLGAVSSGRLTVSNDAARAIRETELSLICVGTPSLPNGDQDQAALLRVAEQIGEALAGVDHFHVVVVRSTVRLGTVDSVLRQTLEASSGKRSDADFALCFQPEFLREGTSIRDYDNPPYTVVGTGSTQAAEMLRSVFGHLPCDFIVTDISTAEALKYACNCFHAVKITFANEIGRVAQAWNVDAQAVMDLVCRDERLNISRAYLRPGFAFGGSCLPKDLRALSYMAKTRDVDIPMLAGVLPSNRGHIERAASMVLAAGGRKVGLIGLSFKKGTDDLRESPLVTLAEHLIGKGMELSVYDPDVNLSVLTGANKRYIEQHIPHIAALLKKDCATVIEGAQTIVVGASLPDAVALLPEASGRGQLIIDLVGLPNARELKGRYEGICWPRHEEKSTPGREPSATRGGSRQSAPVRR